MNNLLLNLFTNQTNPMTESAVEFFWSKLKLHPLYIESPEVTREFVAFIVKAVADEVIPAPFIDDDSEFEKVPFSNSDIRDKILEIHHAVLADNGQG